MNMYDIILKKRNGHALSKEEIDFFIKGYTEGRIPDYQASALLMAIYFQKMNREETVYLTEAMMNSGDVLDLSEIDGVKVDKHSTGGVGDTTTLVLGPMVAAVGAPVAKMSGRGLGHTGGTIDKLETIPGFSVEISNEDFIKNVNEIKLAVCAQTGDLAPADKMLYALRDVTATVDNMSLIASSIMSKKLASGADAIVLDVKTGSGAFMREKEDAFELARIMVNIGNSMGRQTVAVISNMDQPLGRAVGNALEVKEAIETLQGKGPEDLYELCLKLGAQMLVLSKVVEDEEEAIARLKEVVEKGLALEKFKEFIQRQGGDPAVVDNPDLLPKAKYVIDVKTEEGGYIKHIEAVEVGMSALELGAGRENKDSVIDLAVGIELFKKVGDRVEAGDTIARIHSNDEAKTEKALERLLKAYTYSEKEVEPSELIYGIVTE
ncbi:MAG: pyrimidine-nucleoside phosphorylase [Tissierellia bacterium]|nr:pyrimidine-nucleoside phosphorylase [Tissierellia bacterium]